MNSASACSEGHFRLLPAASNLRSSALLSALREPIGCGTHRRVLGIVEALIREEIQLEVKLSDEVDFAGQDLSDKDFHTSFPQRILSYAIFIGSDLRCANLSRFDLRFSDFSDVKAIGIRMDACAVDHSRFHESRCLFGTYVNASLAGSDMTGADFSGAVLRNVDFTGCDLTGARLCGVKARGANFTNAILTGCDLSGSDIRDAVFRGCKVEDTDFTFSNMSECQFHPVDFEKGNYYGVAWNGDKPKDWPRRKPPEGEEERRAKLKKIEFYSSRPRSLKKAIASGDFLKP